jgi:hypothetical protein
VSRTRRSGATLGLLLFIGSLGGIALALTAVLGLGLLGIVAAFEGDELNALTGFWTMAGALTVAVALTPAAYHSGRSVFGYPAAAPGRPSSLWLLPAAGYPVCVLLGWTAQTGGTAPFLLGPLALIGTACLSVILVGWLVRRLGPPLTPVRAWGHFTVGLTAMPAAAMIVELAAALPLLVILGLWLATSPEGRAWASTIQQTAANPDLAFESAMGLLRSPLVLIGVYGYVGLAIPFIEELLKTMAVWPFLRRGLSGAEAFLGGALGGAGYALFEALFLTQPGEGWLVTTLARVGATMLHVFTAALTSYGLMRAFHGRRYGVTAATFIVAMSMHALWNMAAITIGISSVPMAPSTPAGPSAPLGIAGVMLLTLAAASALGLVFAWGRFKGDGAEAS